MPELPDVEGFRRELANTLPGRRIRAVHALDASILRNRTPQQLGRTLTGDRFAVPRRHGKWLILPTRRGRALLVHSGMTGHPYYAAHGENAPHDRLAIDLDHGQFRYADQRKLRGLWLADDAQALESITGELGPDVLTGDHAALVAALRGARGRLKVALADQARIAGIGNLLADEICWQARLHPERDVRELDEPALRRLVTISRRVTRTAARHGCVPPLRGWLTRLRDEPDARCPRCRTPLRATRVGGRRTLCCPHCHLGDRRRAPRGVSRRRAPGTAEVAGNAAPSPRRNRHGSTQRGTHMPEHRSAATPSAKQHDLEGARVRYEDTTLTTNTGTRLSDTDNALRAGERGPTLLEDFHAREKITHFDHERIPERVVHARGSGAHGHFRAYDDSLAGVTAAEFLTDPTRQTPVFVRFSTVAGSRGSADTVRDVRGFATKFYTQEGIFDLVGNNMPVFFIQDGIKFPDFVHAVKPEPHNEIPQAQSAHDTFWDFVSLQPEAMHMVMWLMSDHALPRSYRMMNGFGVHTFRFVNDAGRSTFVKFHWRPVLGAHSLVWDEVQLVQGADPDFNRRDLWEAIENGAFPEWELAVQLVDEADEHAFEFDLLDATKIIPEEQVPLRPVGRMTLDRNPDNFFAETEQVAMHVGHVVPGIDFTDDPLLQGRLFSYLDTQLIRLGGPNFEQLPINRPPQPATNNQRDGYGQQQIPVGRHSYAPNSFGGCPVTATAAAGGYVHFPEQVSGAKIRKRAESFGDHYSQATLFYNSMSDWERAHLVDACAFELAHCAFGHVRERVISCFNEIDHGLAEAVAGQLGMDVPAATRPNHGNSSPALSLANSPRESIATRKIAVLATDGVDLAGLSDLCARLEAEGALFDVIGVHEGNLSHAGGGSAMVDHGLFAVSAALYDGVLVPAGAEALAGLHDARRFVEHCYRHGKVVAAVGNGADLLERALAPRVRTSTGELIDDHSVITAGGADEQFTAAVRSALAAHRDFTRAAL